MKKMKRLMAFVLTLAMSITLIPVQAHAQNKAEIDYNLGNTPLTQTQVTQASGTNQPSLLSSEVEHTTLVYTPSEGTFDTRVIYEIVSGGKAGISTSDTQSAVIRFTLVNPGTEEVSFDYSVLPGSAEDTHLSGDYTGTVTLSQGEPQKDVTIDIAPFADKPRGERPLPNDLNAYWTGEHFFYLYCSDIHNALFDENRQSLTIPVPIESEFDLEASYANAVNTRLINLDQVGGGDQGVFSLQEDGQLKFTGEITGDVRKMIDQGVFTHILLPQGFLINELEEEQGVEFKVEAFNDIFDEETPTKAYIFKARFINLEPMSQTSLYSEEFSQNTPISEICLGRVHEGNLLYNKIDFSFNNGSAVTPSAIKVSFSDESGYYLQHQLSFSDQASPAVYIISTDMSQAYYGDEVPVTIEFTEPVYTDDIRFTVDGQEMKPLEGSGTISQKVSFLYQIGDKALNASDFAIDVSDITGVVDLSGKAMEASASGSTTVSIAFDLWRTFAYCAVPSISLDQGTSPNATVNVTIPLKQDTKLSNWLLERIGEDNISTAVKAKAITADGIQDIPLTVQMNETMITGLTGSFTAPENNTGEELYYGLEIYLKTDSEYQQVDSLITTYAIWPLILVDEESDVTLDYTHWPPADQIYSDEGSSLSLGYFLNVDATWADPEYYIWSSSDENIATIDGNGNITLLGTGEVYFTLTVKNPLNDDVVIIKSTTLTVLEAQAAYLYVPNGIKNQDILIGGHAKINFSSNLTDRNDVYGGSGTETSYTFTLYEAVYDGGLMTKGSICSTETITATVQASLNSYTVSGDLLTKVTPKDQYGYIFEISTSDLQSGNTMTAEAFIRVRQNPAKATLIRPESVFLLDNTGSFTVNFDIENKSSDSQYSLEITKNSDGSPIKAVASPTPIGAVTVDISYVGDSRLMDVYTVSLRAKNPSDDAWSYDSYNVYVYNTSAMSILLDGFPAPGAITMDYDLKDGDVIRYSNFLTGRYLLGKELIRTIKIDDKSYAWSAIADRVTWKVEGESVSLWYDNKRIGDDYNPVLLPGTTLVLRGDGSGTSVVTATHTLTGMNRSMTVTLKPLKDKLYLFRTYPQTSCELVYTNGKGEQKTVSFWGEVGVYEESGIKSDVVIYPVDGAENVYDYGVIPYRTLQANQNNANSFDLYPINTVKLPLINYNVTLELYDEMTGEPYTGDIIIRGGIYYNDKYQAETTINGNLGKRDQKVSSDEQGRYTFAFKPSDFTDKILATDKLRYVIEVHSADNSFLPQYIIVENEAIQAQKNSPLGVCLSEGIKAMNATSIQNGAIILSQRLTIDEKEIPIDKRIYIDSWSKSATLEMTVMVPNTSEEGYRLLIKDPSTGSWKASPVGELVHAYPFSDMVTLNFKFDFSNIYSLVYYGLELGQVGFYSIIIQNYWGTWQLQLSQQLELQNLIGVRNMDDSLNYRANHSEGDYRKFWEDIWNLSRSPEKITVSGYDAVSDALDIMDDYYLNSTSIGLEINPTDDPLVYNGIIRVAVGSYSKDNPSGVFLGGDQTTSLSFLPGLSDIKAMSKGTFMKKAKEEMNKARGLYKRYGGGAYIVCEVYYDLDDRDWKIRMLYGDFYLGGGGSYKIDYNGWVSFVPVTATFEFSVNAEIGLTILHSRTDNTTAYITRLRPVFSIYGFGGVGQDYKFVTFKAGGFGQVTHEQLYLWYNDDDGSKMNGQQLTISGEVGVKFEFRIAFVEYGKKYVLADYSKSWNFNDFNKLKKLQENKTGQSKKMLLISEEYLDSEGISMLALVPVEESVTFEDRSYLDAYERSWATPEYGLRMFALLSEDSIKDVWKNAYPFAEPKISDDGELMAYVSDMNSKDLSDSAVLFAVKDDTGAFSTEGTEIDPSPYPDSSPYLAGTKDGAYAAWVRSFTDIREEAGSEASMEDVIKGLAASEVMVGVYKDGAFKTTRLTTNDNPDFAPVIAGSGDRAIAVWRNVTLGDMDDPLNYTSDYIMYSIYDGSKWSEARCLYDGSMERVQAINTAMLPDGTSAIVYQIRESEGDSEIICTVLNQSGDIVRSLKLTDNSYEDLNPQITTAEFPDGEKRFVIGWGTKTERGVSELQLLAVNPEGTLYSEFTQMLSDSTGETDYSNFAFSKGVEKLEDLSLLWSQPEDEDQDGIYVYHVFGTKLLVSADNTVTASGTQRLLSLEEGRSLNTLDSRVNPDTGKLHFLMLLTEANESSTLAMGEAEYKNKITVIEPEYDYEELLPGLDMPVMFTVTNDGIDPITHVSIGLGEQSYDYNDENILSGESKTYLISYAVPDTLSDTNYSVTAQFGKSGDSYKQTGVMKLGLPDVGIYQISSTKETERERGFRVQLQNFAFADLKKGTHTVKLEVWNYADFAEGSPLKTYTVSEDDFDKLNNSILSVNVTLKEKDLKKLLNESGELPDGGVPLLFRVVLSEEGNPTEDADISNDMDYVNVYSLIAKKGSAVSTVSLYQTIEGKTTVQVEAFNNSMQTIDNGNIIVTLRDVNGNVVETQQTYSSSDDKSLLTIPGEETKTISLQFSQSGYIADVTFARVSGESTLLSVLNLTGSYIEFDPNVFEYHLKTYGLKQTILTAVAENPEATITVKKNGVPVSLDQPIAISYGTTELIIIVTTDTTNTSYTVRIENIKPDEDTDPEDPGEIDPEDPGEVDPEDPGEVDPEDPGEVDPEDPGKGDSGEGTNTSISEEVKNLNAELIIGGSKKEDISICIRDKHAVLSLGTLALELLSGDVDAVLSIPAVPGVEGYTLELPASALAGPNTGTAITIATELGRIRIPAGMLAGMENIEGKTVGITLGKADTSELPDDIKAMVGNHPILSLTMTLDGEEMDWSNPDASVTVDIPYVPTAKELKDLEGIVIWYIDDSGHAVTVVNGRYDLTAATVTFNTNHFSNYVVVYKPVSFQDVGHNAWYSKAVSFIAARDITKGTGNGKYSPNATLTRADCLVMLMRAFDIKPEENPRDNFSDVGDSYYTGYLAKAKMLGITTGVGNNKFAPEKAITRQEMFTMLYNILKVTKQIPEKELSDAKAKRKSLTAFLDEKQIASWARKATAFLVEQGIVNGKAGNLMPKKYCTRADIAQVIYNTMTK